MKRLAIVIALTLCAGGLAGAARADEPAPPPPSSETPLQLRPTPRPLDLAPANGGIGGGWKIVLLVAAGALGLFWYKRKRAAAGGALEDVTGDLKVLRRTSLGARGELVIVQADGQRLLLGVTSQAIHSLATLSYDDAAMKDAPVVETAGGDATLGDRFAAMLGSAAPRAAAPAPTPRPPATLPLRAKDDDDDAEIAGQARGLVALARGRKR